MEKETKTLYRSQDDRWLAGVCGGLGIYLNMDPTLIRVVFILLALFGSSGFWIYLILWLVIPQEPTASGAAKSDTFTDS